MTASKGGGAMKMTGAQLIAAERRRQVSKSAEEVKVNLLCWLGIHKWRSRPIPDIGTASGIIVLRTGRVCERCGEWQWQPYAGGRWMELDITSHDADVNRRITRTKP